MILSHLVGILESHDGFYDLVIHRTNSPNLLMPDPQHYSPTQAA